MKLLLFDIDGTLVLSGGAGLRAMTSAFEDVFAVNDGALDIPMGGRTDSWIVEQASRQHGFTYDATDLRRFHDAYVVHLAREMLVPGPRKGMMPGVRPLLDVLAEREDVYLALLTGNFEQGARIKLEYFDLWHYFKGGAFGDRTIERNHLLPLALEAVRARSGVVARPEDTVIIGDTPLDVAVALAGGVRSVAVATGSHGVAELSETGADVVLSDLADVQTALGALGLG